VRRSGTVSTTYSPRSVHPTSHVCRLISVFLETSPRPAANHHKLACNPLDSKGNYSATSNNTKLVHWPLMGGLLHLVQRGGAWAGRAGAPPSPLLAVPNVTAHHQRPVYQSLYCYMMVRCSAVLMWQLKG